MVQAPPFAAIDAADAHEPPTREKGAESARPADVTVPSVAGPLPEFVTVEGAFGRKADDKRAEREGWSVGNRERRHETAVLLHAARVDHLTGVLTCVDLAARINPRARISYPARVRRASVIYHRARHLDARAIPSATSLTRKAVTGRRAGRRRDLKFRASR
jgi:hypothetical protein